MGHSISLETAPEMKKFSWCSNIIVVFKSMYSSMKSKPSLKPLSILGVIFESVLKFGLTR